MFFSLILKIPFIAIHENSINGNDLEKILEICNCGLIATSDENVISILSQNEFKDKVCRLSKFG